MSTRSVRRGIGQASWNEQFASTYSWHMLAPAIALGWLTQSWAAFLVCYVGIHVLVNQFEVVRVTVMMLYSFFWAYVVFFIASLLLGLEAGIVFGLIALAISYENLRSGWQYWNDLV